MNLQLQLKTTQSSEIRQAIFKRLEKRMNDKQEIYSQVVEELNVPRPTVRRVSRDLKTELEKYAKILNNDFYKNRKRY